MSARFVFRVGVLPAVVVALLVFPCAAFSDDGSPHYSSYGAIGISAVTGWNARTGTDAVAMIAGNLFLETSHRFSLDRAEFFLHDKVIEPFAQPNTGLSPAQRVAVPELSLYEAYVRVLPASWLSFSIGRHRFSWGNGLLLSPSDSFQPSAFQVVAGEMPTTLQDSSAQTGFTGIGIQLFPSANLTASVGVSLDDALNAGTLGPQRARFGGIVSFVVDAFDCFLSGVFQDHETLRPGVGVSVDVLGVILRGEAALELVDRYVYPFLSGAAVSFGRDDSGTPRFGFSGGIEKAFSLGDDTLSVFAEYLALDWGYSRDQERMFFSSVPAFVPLVPQPMGRQYANLLISLGREDAWEWDNLFMVDLFGPGIMGSHTFRFLGFKGFVLAAGMTWLAGDSDTEFGFSADKLFGTVQAQVDF